VWVSKIKYKLVLLYRKIFPQRLFGYYKNTNNGPRGDVLLSYLVSPLRWDIANKHFWGHSNKWECAEIAHIFNKCGYSVDAVQFDDNTFKPYKKYDIVFDIHKNLQNYSKYGSISILYVTGSYPRYSNAALDERLSNLERRRGVRLLPRRSISTDLVCSFDDSIRIADYIILIGNEWTKSTMPFSVHQKINLIPVTASYLPILRSFKDFKPRKEFLWFGGSGAVHKGLDLVLEIFKRNKDLTLHVIGPYELEKDFCELYKQELNHCTNIKTHGYVYPNSKRFRKIVEHVIGFIYPSCSESISTAAVTCMQYGIIPIISIDTGIELEKNEGIILVECSLEKIEQSINTIAMKNDSEIKEMAFQAQKSALNKYSRTKYSQSIENHIQLIINSYVGK